MRGSISVYLSIILSLSIYIPTSVYALFQALDNTLVHIKAGPDMLEPLMGHCAAIGPISPQMLAQN